MRGKGKKRPKKIKLVWRKKTTPAPPRWVELPRDITANILHRLGAVEILESAQKVCTTWRSVCKDPAFWRVIDMHNLGPLRRMPYILDIMCRHAVDRSQGQLIDINIEYFGADNLLEYIAESCSQLRCLRIVGCFGVSGEALSRFPLLEELHLFFTSISSESLEMVGRSCPLLKSFSLNGRGFRYVYHDKEYDEEALIIAKSMPELRHLQLFGNALTNKGLQAILDGCPHLESLDLRRCYSVELGGDLWKRCSQQIKSLRSAFDSAADYEISDFDLGAGYDDEYDNDYEDFTRHDDPDVQDFFDF